jgi:hypothetical protein
MTKKTVEMGFQAGISIRKVVLIAWLARIYGSTVELGYLRRDKIRSNGREPKPPKGRLAATS